jgi:hypothetical protein
MHEDDLISKVAEATTRIECLREDVKKNQGNIESALYEIAIINHQIKAGKLLFKSSAVVFIAVLIAEFAFMFYLNSREIQNQQTLSDTVRKEVQKKLGR